MWHSFLRTVFFIVFAMSPTIVSISESEGLILNWQHEKGDVIRLSFEIPSLTDLEDGKSYTFSVSAFNSRVGLIEKPKPSHFIYLDYSPDSADIGQLDFSSFSGNIQSLSWSLAYRDAWGVEHTFEAGDQSISCDMKSFYLDPSNPDRIVAEFEYSQGRWDVEDPAPAWGEASVVGMRYPPPSTDLNLLIALVIPFGAVFLWKGLRKRR